ncbi:hypothetical protein D3C81_1803920 [compost metagenome]
MNRSALQNKMLKIIAVQTLDLQHFLFDQQVLIPWKIQSSVKAPPSVKTPVNSSNSALAVHNKGRADIPHPGVVGRKLYNPDGLRHP